MSHQPRRMIDDPDWGEAFQSFAGEQQPIDGMPGDVRAEVAAMIATSVAGVAGLAAGIATTTSVASTGSAVGGGAVGGGAVGGAAVVGGTTSVAAGTAAVAATGTSVAAGSAAVGAASSAVVGATGLGAAGTALASIGMVPKVIAAISLAGAMTAGGAVVVERAATVERTVAVERAAVVEHSAAVEQTAAGQTAAGQTAAGQSTPHGSAAALAASVETDEPPSSETDAVDGLGQEPENLGAAAGPELSLGTPSVEATSVDKSPLVRKKQPAPVRLGLADEVSLLRKVRAALAKDPEAAWRHLNTYNKRYPSGDLRAEYDQLVARAQAAQPTPEE